MPCAVHVLSSFWLVREHIWFVNQREAILVLETLKSGLECNARVSQSSSTRPIGIGLAAQTYGTPQPYLTTPAIAS